MKKWNLIVLLAISIILVGSLTFVYLNKEADIEVETLRKVQQQKLVQSEFNLGGTVGNGTGKEAHNFSKNETEELYRKDEGVGINKDNVNIFIKKENLSNLDCSWKVGDNQWVYVGTGTIPPNGRHCAFDVDISNKGNSTINIADFLGEEIDLDGKSWVMPIIEQAYNITVEVDNRTRNETTGERIGKIPELINITVTRYKWVNDTSSFKLDSMNKKSLKLLFKPRFDRYFYDINFTSQIDNISKEFFIPEPFVDIIELAPPNGTNMTVDAFNVTLQAEIGGDTTDNKDVYIYAGNVTQPEIRDGLVALFKNVANGTVVSYNFTGLPINSSSEGLVLLYHFDNRSEFGENDTANGVVFNFANASNNGTIVGNPTSNDTGDTCKFGGCFEFDGSGDFITGDAVHYGASPNFLTMMAWVNLTDQNGRMTIIGSENVNNVIQMEVDTQSDINAGINIIEPGTFVAQAEFNWVATTSWHHVAYVRNGTGSGNHTFYIDGVVTGTDTDGTANFVQGTGVTTIGRRSSGSQEVEGMLDDVAIWNRALSATEIADIYRLRAGDYFWYVNGTNITGGDDTISEVRCLSSSGGCPADIVTGQEPVVIVNNLAFNETEPYTYDENGLVNFSFNVSLLNGTLDTVIVRNDLGQNFTASVVVNISASAIISNLFVADEHNLTILANNTNGTLNNTEVGLFNVTKATPIVVINVNETNSLIFPDNVNITSTFNSNEQSITLEVNGTTFNLNQSLLFGANQDWNATVLVPATQNFTFGSASQKFNVTQAAGALTITSENGTSVIFPDVHNFTTNIGNGEQNIVLTVNGTTRTMNNSIILGVMEGWNVTAISLATQNFTFASDEIQVNVTIGSRTTTLFLNGSNSNITIGQGNFVNISGNNTDSEGLFEFFVDSIFNGSASTPTGSIGNRNFTDIGNFTINVTVNQTQNRSISSQTFSVSVIDTTPPTISNVRFWAYDIEQNFLGDETFFNTLNLTIAEETRVNFTLSDVSVVTNWTLLYHMNGTNSCSTGNRQDIKCYNGTNDNWIEFIQGNTTDTFRFDLDAVGDEITCSQIVNNATSINVSCIFDEHDRNIHFKSFPLNYTNTQFQNDTTHRITKNNVFMILPHNLRDIPINMDNYEIEFEVNGTFGQSAPNVPLEVYAFNESYLTTNGTCEENINCALVAAKLTSEFIGTGISYAAIMTKGLIDTLNGGLAGFWLHAGENNQNKFYSLQTFECLNKSASGNTTFYSNDDGDTYIVLENDQCSNFNVNGFIDGVNPTSFVFKIQGTDSIGNVGNTSEFNLTWDIDPNQNFKPIVDLEVPLDEQIINGTAVDFNWTINEPNNNNTITNLSIHNKTTGALVLQIVTDNTSQGFVHDRVDVSGITIGQYEVRLNVTETNDGSDANLSTFLNISVNITQIIFTTSINIFDIVFNETSPQAFGVILNNSANITSANSTVDTVIITLDNGRNITVVGIDNISFSAIINNLPAGQNQNFTWWGNNSAGDINNTEKGMFNITAFQIEGDMLINGALNSNQSFTYPQQTEVSANSTGGTVTLFQDGVIVTNPHNRTLGVATYIYKSNGTVANANFTQNISMQIHSVTITQGNSATNLLLNGSSGNISLSNGTIIDVNATASNIEGNLQIFIAEVLNQTGTSPIGASRNFTGFGLVNVTACYAETNNWTRTCETHFVNITTLVVDSFPVIVALDPVNNSNTILTAQNFTANYTDDINLFNSTFYWNGLFNQTESINGTSNSSVFELTNLLPSNNTFSVVVCDDNNQCTQSINRSFEVLTADTTPPSLIWNTPLNNSVITSSNTITFDFNASDNVDLQNISLIVNGLFQQTETSLTNNISINQSFTRSLSNGIYNISLRLVDTSNNINNSDIRVINLTVSAVGGESDSSLLSEITLIFYGSAFVLFFFSNKLRDIHSAFKWILSMIAIILLVGGIGTAVILADNLVTSQVSASSLVDIQEKIALGYRAILAVFWFLMAYLILFQVLFPPLITATELTTGRKTDEAERQRRY